MALVTGSWLLDSLLCLLLLIFLVYRYFSNIFGYFRVRGIPYLPVNMKLLDNAQVDISNNLYNTFPGERIFGYFLFVQPIFLVKDLDLIQRIMVKDFTHFEDRGVDKIESDFLNTKTLFNLQGKAWRALRNKISPTFSSGKLQLMFKQFAESADHVLESIEEGEEKTFDVKRLGEDYAVEVVASTAFGLDFSKENPQKDTFVKRATTVFRKDSRQMIAFFTNMFFPKLAALLGMSFLSPGSEEYFFNLTQDTKEFRRKNNIKRNDYFDLLLQLQEDEERGKSIVPTSSVDNKGHSNGNQNHHTPDVGAKAKSDTKLLDDKTFAAQAFTFLVGGSESISNTIAFALYHIAKEDAVQKKLIQEIDTVIAKHDGCTYEAMKEMKYLDQVLQETLRFYPLLPLTMRQCVIPYRIPDSDIVFEKGARINIPVSGLHMDPKNYPEPKIFDPERFVDNNHKPSPKYLPFGDGPRMCIAQRFSIIEMKTCLAKIVSQYSLKVNSRTEEPLVMDKNSFSPKPVGRLWLDFEKRV